MSLFSLIKNQIQTANVKKNEHPDLVITKIRETETLEQVFINLPQWDREVCQHNQCREVYQGFQQRISSQPQNLSRVLQTHRLYHLHQMINELLLLVVARISHQNTQVHLRRENNIVGAVILPPHLQIPLPAAQALHEVGAHQNVVIHVVSDLLGRDRNDLVTRALIVAVRIEVVHIEVAAEEIPRNLMMMIATVNILHPIVIITIKATPPQNTQVKETIVVGRTQDLPVQERGRDQGPDLQRIAQVDGVIGSRRI